MYISEKNRKLVKKYPFLQQLNLSNSNLNITVQVADGYLMYKKGFAVVGHMCGIGKHVGQKMLQEEDVYGFNGGGVQVSHIRFPQEGFNSPFYYGRDVLMDPPRLSLLGDDKAVKHIVWITKKWYQNGPQENETNVTLFLEPKCGFKELFETSCFEDFCVLSFWDMIWLIGKKNNDALAVAKKLDGLCSVVEKEIFNNGLKNFMDDKNSECQWTSSNFEDIKFGCTKEKDEKSYYIIMEDSTSRFYVRTSNSTSLFVETPQGTFPQIKNLVEKTVREWKKNGSFRIRFKQIL